jgi:hypothetical protein
MKSNLFILCFLSAIPVCSPAQGLINTNGSSLVSNDAVTIVIQDGGLTNNGTFIKSTGTIAFTGNSSTSSSFVGGTAATDFYNLTLNKTANGLQLNRNIGVSNLVTFTSGDSIFLNNYTVDLGSTGSISGENNNSRFTGQTGGYIMITQSLNAPAAVNPGNLGIDITSAADLGSTVIKRSQTVFRNKSITRNFEILPANNAALNATLVFHYFPSELRSIVESTLATYSSSNGGVNWSFVGNTTLSTPFDYITSTNINSFDLFTLFNQVDLPVQLLFLKGNAVNKTVELNWATSGEIDNDHFEIERSVDGINFSTIGKVNGNGNSSIQQTFLFTDHHPIGGTNYYRLKQVDNNQMFTHTRIISVLIKSDPQIDITLSPNPATNILFVKITGADPGQADLKLMGQNGKLYKTLPVVCKKDEVNFSINIEDLPKGLYYIRFSGVINHSIKFIKVQ